MGNMGLKGSASLLVCIAALGLASAASAAQPPTLLTLAGAHPTKLAPA
jgi:hypothetical protein